MEGVDHAFNLNPGGYVPANANNHNGSAVSNHIPAVRDFDVNPLPADDPDLKEIQLSIAPSGIPLPHKGRLWAFHGGRAEIKVWDTRRKNNEIILPMTWLLEDMPRQLYVEGVLEGVAERETLLRLECLDGTDHVWGRDDLLVTVTPILLELIAIKNEAAAPELDRARVSNGVFNNRNCRILNTKKGAGRRNNAITLRSKVFRRGAQGVVRLGQKVRIVNMLFGAGGADLGGNVTRSWDWTAAPAGSTLMDTGIEALLPFYLFEKNPLGTLGHIQTIVEGDSPKLVLEDGAGGFTDVLPPVGAQTVVDVGLEFVIYAIWQFTDKSAYFLGEARYWSVRFQGTLTPKAGGGYTFAPGIGNAVVGTNGSFNVSNAVPTELGGPSANQGGANWQ